MTDQQFLPEPAPETRMRNPSPGPHRWCVRAHLFCLAASGTSLLVLTVLEPLATLVGIALFIVISAISGGLAHLIVRTGRLDKVERIFRLDVPARPRWATAAVATDVCFGLAQLGLAVTAITGTLDHPLAGTLAAAIPLILLVSVVAHQKAATARREPTAA
ncbi:hypothetical protein [Streptomyces goshikiensis]|uniref:hypothetical protein n=1 Tax=Streptomyces goshikiensis TaxID=1942 RepID=UPI00368C1201